jgi:hypothetical protein
MIKERLFKSISCAIIAILGLASVVSGAELSLVPTGASDAGIAVVRVVIHIDRPVNAIMAKVRYDASVLHVQSISLANSPISLWAQSPKVESPGTITFAGAIPGGLSPELAAEVTVFTIRFEVQKSGPASLMIEEPVIYLHTPDSQRDIVEAIPTTIAVSSMRASPSHPLILDFSPPELFTPILVSNPDLASGAYVLVFQGSDKGSGIARYYVRERWLGIWGVWQEVQNPYQIKDQRRFSIIDLKAVDGVGHERVIRIIPKRLKFTWTVLASSLILCIGVLMTRLRQIYASRRKKVRGDIL